MNIAKLKQAESAFLAMYPQGMQSPEMIEIGKKHKMAGLVAFSHNSFSKEALMDTAAAAENMVRMVSRSTMVSLFEKPKFRDAVRGMGADTQADLANSLYEFLHGDEAAGFHQMLGILEMHKLAKWTLMTVWRCYYYPQTDLLYKPTTVKNVIHHFELDGLIYKPRPSYDFFVGYRSAIAEMKKSVDSSLATSSPEFSGFLMMAMEL